MINLELKKGMYIRTNKGKIDKIIKQIDNSGSLHHNNYVWVLDKGDMLALHSNKVKNASFNLIDLIQKGDYVNGILIESIYERTDEHLLCHAFNEEIMFEITKDNIEDIVTKEQFNCLKYEVK